MGRTYDQRADGRDAIYRGIRLQVTPVRARTGAAPRQRHTRLLLPATAPATALQRTVDIAAAVRVFVVHWRDTHGRCMRCCCEWRCVNIKFNKLAIVVVVRGVGHRASDSPQVRRHRRATTHTRRGPIQTRIMSSRLYPGACCEPRHACLPTVRLRPSCSAFGSGTGTFRGQFQVHSVACCGVWGAGSWPPLRGGNCTCARARVCVHAFVCVHAGRADLECGDKIILPSVCV